MEDIFEDKFEINGMLLSSKHILIEVNLKGVVNSISLVHAISEEFRNSHGGADAGAGTGTYLCDSNCDMFNLTQ